MAQTTDEKRKNARNKSKTIVNKKGKTLTRSGENKLGRNEGMREGRTGAKGYNVGKRVNERDIKEMQAQGFADEKIAKVLTNKNKEVGGKASAWLNAQLTKGTQNPPDQNPPGQSTPQNPESPEPQNTDPASNSPEPVNATPAAPAVETTTGGAQDPANPTDYQDNSVDYRYDGGEGNINGNDNQGGIGNQNARDTGDLTQTAETDNTQTNTQTQDNDNTQDNSNNSGTINTNIDNSQRIYGGSSRTFNYQSGNTGNQEGGGGGSGVDSPASMATMAGFYDVDDSPAANAQFVDMYSDMNNQLQKKHTQGMTGTAQTAIDQAAQNSYINPAKLDNRILARQKASTAKANVMGSHIFGDQGSLTPPSWSQPKKEDEVEDPDFEGMYNTYANF